MGTLDCPEKRHMNINALVDRLSEDPDFIQRFRKDPAGVAAAEGYSVTDAEARAALGIGAGDDLSVALEARLSKCLSCGYNGM